MILSPFKKTPDILLSIGTGLSHVDYRRPGGEPSSERTVPVRWIIKRIRNRWLPRLCRTFSFRMLERPVKQALSSWSWYHRMDVDMGGDEPSLDDFSSIPALKQRVDSDHTLRLPLKHIAHCAIASLFYFELASPPSRYEGPYKGHGHIRCSLDSTEPALRLLLTRLLATRSSFYLDQKPLGCGSCLSNGGFELKVNLALSGDFSVFLRQADGKPCHISGSPFSVSRLAVAQKMFAPFGTAEHRIKRKLEVFDTSRKRTRRR